MASATDASSGGGRGGGKRKSLDAELNLVPFIDLLSMCICFLLMTAVWTQMAAVQVKQSNGTAAAEPDPTKTDWDLRLNSARSMSVKITRGSKTVGSVQLQGRDFQDLVDQLKDFASQQAKGNNVASALITPVQEVSYGELVHLMDRLRESGITNLGIVPVKAR